RRLARRHRGDRRTGARSERLALARPGAPRHPRPHRVRGPRDAAPPPADPLARESAGDPVPPGAGAAGGMSAMPTLFPIAEFWWLYGGFIAVVLGLLALDLGVMHRDDREVGVREAAVWCVVWVVLALLFNAG